MTGWFPANRVELLTRSKTSPTHQDSIDTNASSTSSGLLSTHLSLSHTSNLSRLHSSNLSASSSSLAGLPSSSYALALYSYTADNMDELTFYKGSVISIVSKEDPDWWKGEMNGQIGLVPANYVQELDDLQSSITSTRCKHMYNTHACICVYIHAWMHTYIHSYMCTYILTYMCMYIIICMHTT